MFIKCFVYIVTRDLIFQLCQSESTQSFETENFGNKDNDNMEENKDNDNMKEKIGGMTYVLLCLTVVYLSTKCDDTVRIRELLYTRCLAISFTE